MIFPWISVVMTLFSLSEVLSLSEGDIKKLSSLTPISPQGMLNVSHMVKLDMHSDKGLLFGKHPMVTMTGGISEDNGANPGEELMLSDGPMMRDEPGHGMSDAPCSMEDVIEEEKKLAKEEEEFKALVEKLKNKTEKYRLEESAFESFKQARNNTELLGKVKVEDEEKLKEDLKKLQDEESKLNEKLNEILKNETALEQEEDRYKNDLKELDGKEHDLKIAIEKLKDDLRNLSLTYEKEEKKEQDERGFVCIDMSPDPEKKVPEGPPTLPLKLCNPIGSDLDITKAKC